MEEYEEVEYMRDNVNLLVETQKGNLVISHMEITPEDTFHLLHTLVDMLSEKTGVSYNETLEDLKVK